ncbi:uncharacterized protein LOC114841466 [Diachasma alloeum]|uniref:uncharacterized protein LOC114841466 n=1 Tax=Diachasma alloeum TaxID=454923 RepID=UPI0010FADE6C|nr:uncharacterized protein LOC114841466 [Diachasma alloeum]
MSQNIALLASVSPKFTEETLESIFQKATGAKFAKVIPAFENFLQSKGACDLLNVPKCLKYLHDGENDFLVLEDVTTKGFTHAVGKQDIWTTNMNTTVKAAMTQQYPGTPEEKRFNAITPDQLFRRCANCCEAKKDSPIVVNHGDAWAFNFMTRTLDSREGEAVIFDFQLARLTSPVLDISYFLYTCTDKDTRDKYFYELLEYYHSELGNIVSRLGSSIADIYPENYFMKDVKEQFVLGVAFAVDILPMMLTTEDGLSNIESFTNDEGVNISLMWKLDADLPPESNKRIADAIVHVIQQGFL